MSKLPTLLPPRTLKKMWRQPLPPNSPGNEDNPSRNEDDLSGHEDNPIGAIANQESNTPASLEGRKEDNKKTTVLGDHPGPSKNPGKCTYSKGGVCRVHGGGAKLHYKLVSTPKPGPNGKPFYELKKTGFYTCDLGPKTGMKLRQPLLSFDAMNRGRGKNIQKEGKNFMNISATCTEGKNTADEKAGINLD